VHLGASSDRTRRDQPEEPILQVRRQLDVHRS
jgi:hypothetical protein